MVDHEGERKMKHPGRKKLLLSVDGSEHALHAVRYAAATAPADEVEVVLFHIMTRIPESFWDLQNEPAYHYRFLDIGEWETQQEKMIQEFMSQACDILCAANIPRESVTVKIQDRKMGIAQDIIAESRCGYDTVVVGRRGVSELKDLVLGSIANKLVEKLAQVPIWVIGAGQQRGKILVSLDASEGAMLAVDYVARMVGCAAFEVTLFHVMRGFDIFQQGVRKPAAQAPDSGWQERLAKELEQAGSGIDAVFAEATKRLVEAGMEAARVSRKVVKGASSRAGAIVEEVEKGGFDTVVVGRRGLSKVQEFFMGRVSNKVIHLAKDKTVWVVG
jgi:nucleotide-binding universal stress UspA family protein